MNSYKTISLSQKNVYFENIETLESNKDIIKDDINLREFYTFIPFLHSNLSIKKYHYHSDYDYSINSEYNNDSEYNSDSEYNNDLELNNLPEFYTYYPFFTDIFEFNKLIFNELKNNNLLINYPKFRSINFAGRFIKLDSLILFKKKFLNKEWFCFEIIFNNLKNIPNYYYEHLQNQKIILTKTKIINETFNLKEKYGNNYKDHILFKRVQNRINKLENNKNYYNSDKDYIIKNIDFDEIENKIKGNKEIELLREFYTFIPFLHSNLSIKKYHYHSDYDYSINSEYNNDSEYNSDSEYNNDLELNNLPEFYTYYPFFTDIFEFNKLIFNELKNNNLLINYPKFRSINFAGRFIKLDSLILFKKKFLNKEWFCFEIIFNNLKNIPNYYYEHLQNQKIILTKTKIINETFNLKEKYGNNYKDHILFKRVQNRINKLENNKNYYNSDKDYIIKNIDFDEIENNLLN